jgi:hypothetical protein
MSLYSNHEPEAIDACRFAEDPREMPPRCTCEPEGMDVGQMCPQCQSDYEQWVQALDAQERAAFDMVLENVPEPCGQQFPEEPPEKLPF